MSAGRLETDSRGAASPSALPDEAPARTLLIPLRRSFALLAVLALVGGAVSVAVSAIRPQSFRAGATLLVVEPRLGGGGVDFNLTPIRSYLALLTSPALCVPCAAQLPAAERSARGGPRVKVRMPENTRLLEISYDGANAAGATAFVNCVASGAEAENRRLNLELQGRMRSTIDDALAPAHAVVETLDAELTAARAKELVELRRKELRQAFAELETSRDERLRARLQLPQAMARAKSLGTGEKGAAEARADAEAARALATESEAAGREAEQRATRLEQSLSRTEAMLDRMRRGLEGAAAVEAEMLRRGRLASIEGAAKSFDLITVVPATSRSTAPAASLVFAAGALATFVLGALGVLSRP
ncbi:MAG: hypothetical protein ABIT01_08895 [Thermoanaerobaculia bacterium]